MKKIIFSFLLVSIFSLLAILGTGCSAPSPDAVNKTITGTRAYNGNTASRAMDGKFDTGWVSAVVPSELNMPLVTVDFDEPALVSSITIDDSFESGRTAPLKEYEIVSPLVKSTAFKYASVPEEEKTAIHVFDDDLNGGWISSVVPTESEPQAFYGEFRSAIDAERVTMDNSFFGVVPVEFSIYVSESAVAEDNKLDPTFTGWKKVMEFTDNTEETVVQDLDELTSVKAVLYVVSKQGSATRNACLSAINFSVKVQNIDRNHYPVEFDIYYSVDGDEYEIISITKNKSPVYTHTFEEPMTLKSIKYVPKIEYDGNKPSLGEIIIK